MRYRITFSKTQAMRFTSHLDLYSTLERAMRRANLPLVYSEGFTPRPKLNLASALPLGYTSECELADFWLKEEKTPDEVHRALAAASPPGIALHKTELVPLDAPKLQNTLTSAEFEATLLETCPKLENAVEDLLSAAAFSQDKKSKGKLKSYDLRPLILEIEILPPDEQNHQRLRLHLKAEPSATGRPDETLKALGIDPLNARIHRTRLIFDDAGE